MILRARALAIVGLALVTLTTTWAANAATPRPLTAPPPDLTRLAPFAAAPLDKPPVAVTDVAAPAPPVDMPVVPPAPVALPAAERPVAFLTPPRTLPCIGAFFRVATESLECGKSRFRKGEYDDAVKALADAVKNANDRETQIQSRYWLGESLVRLGKTVEADWQFRQVVGDTVGLEYEVWSAHAAGWMALRLSDWARANEMFTKVLARAMPASIDAWARHGLGLSFYALGKYAEAERVWAEVMKRGVAPALARDVAFWHGESLGRVAEYAQAESELKGFTAGGQHPLLDPALIRFGWWALAAGHAAESASAFKAYMAPSARGPAPKAEQDWADAGLAFALASSGDWNGARNAASGLGSRKSSLALPVSLKLMRSAIDAKKPGEAPALAQELLAGTITPGVRTFILLTKGDALRLEGNRDEARTQYDLAQKADPGSTLSAHAALRLAQTNFEMREFAQATADLHALLQSRIPPELRAAALLLQGEAAYRGSNWAVATAAFRRVVVEFPQHPQAALARLSLPWIALRQSQKDDARQLFLDFAKALPDNAYAVDALVLAAELTLTAGDFPGARQQLEHVIGAYPMQPRTDFARLNRAILMVRSGQSIDAQPLLRDWLARAPSPPLVGRAHAALAAALLATNQLAEAGTEFAAAQQEGVGAFASLGLGTVALVQGRLDAATKALTDARDTGTADISAMADYGLAAVALERGGLKEFKQPALAALKQSPSGPMAPRLLYILTGIAVEERDLTTALDSAKKLALQFPDDEAAPDALERVGSAAARTASWPTVYEAYSLLRQKYPGSPFVDESKYLVEEAALQTGRASEARSDLEKMVVTSPNDGQAWILLARAREASGDRPGALEAYTRATKEAKGPEWNREALLGHARLLALDKRWDQARAVLDPLLKSDDQLLMLEAAYSIGEAYRGEGDLLAAAEYYMTAAYVAPDSAFGRRSMLAAGQAFAALKQPDAAATVYRKLLAQANLPGDLADAARQGLQAVGRADKP